MATYNDRGYFDLDLRSESGSASVSAQASSHQRQASDTPFASSEVSQRLVSPPSGTALPAPTTTATTTTTTTTTTITSYTAAADFAAYYEIPGSSQTAADPSIAPSPSFPSDPRIGSGSYHNNFSAGIATQRTTRSNTLSSDYNPNQVIKRKPLSSTASAIVARFSGSAPGTTNIVSGASQETSAPHDAQPYRPSHSRDTSVYSSSEYAFSEVYVVVCLVVSSLFLRSSSSSLMFPPTHTHPYAFLSQTTVASAGNNATETVKERDSHNWNLFLGFSCLLLFFPPT